VFGDADSAERQRAYADARGAARLPTPRDGSRDAVSSEDVSAPVDLAQVVAQSADTAGLHATVPALLLELQTQLGTLAATATAATERGRRPFRPPLDWAARLGSLAYGVYLLADQSGVDLAAEVRGVAAATARNAELSRQQDQAGWPFETR